MTIPTWSVGQVLTADDVNTWLVPMEALKTGDQAVTSSTALVNDSQLFLSVAANAAYRFECWLAWIATTGADIKWTWAVPAGASLLYSALRNEGGTTLYNNSANVYQDSDVLMANGSSPLVTSVTMKGVLQTSGTSGTVRLKWAQNTTSGSSTHVRAPSYIELQRIG